MPKATTAAGASPRQAQALASVAFAERIRSSPSPWHSEHAKRYLKEAIDALDDRQDTEVKVRALTILGDSTSGQEAIAAYVKAISLVSEGNSTEVAELRIKLASEYKGGERAALGRSRIPQSVSDLQRIR